MIFQTDLFKYLLSLGWFRHGRGGLGVMGLFLAYFWDILGKGNDKSILKGCKYKEACHCINWHWSILLLNVMGPCSKEDTLMDPAQPSVQLLDYKSISIHLVPGVIAANMVKYSSNLEENLSLSVDVVAWSYFSYLSSFLWGQWNVMAKLATPKAVDLR